MSEGRNNWKYTKLRPHMPVPFFLDMLMNWDDYRELTKTEVAYRVLLPIQVGRARFLGFENEERCVYTVTRLPKDPMLAMLRHGPGPATWAVYPGGILWVVDVVTTPGVSAFRYAPAIIQSLYDEGLAVEGESVCWVRAKTGRVCRARVQNYRPPEAAVALRA